MRTQAVVFDKDGVLADSEAINLGSAFEVFRAHGFELDPTDIPAIVGKHPRHYVPILARRFAISESEQRQIVAEQDATYTRSWNRVARLFDGAREAIDAVRRRGLPVGLATSSSRAEVEQFLDRFELRTRFDLTLSLDDVTHPKPHPEIYLSAAARLAIEPARMIVVEDSEYGVRAAKDAGAICVAIRSGHVDPERLANADHRIDSIAELIDVLDDWQQ